MILMIYTSFSSFVESDYKILSKKHTIKKYQYNNTKSEYKQVFVNDLQN